MHIGTRTQTGDTIVEVLLAIGIISVVIAGAFVATNRSLQASRAAQERSEALKVAESQVEDIKYNKDNGSWTEPAGMFCIEADETTIQDVTDIVNTPDCLQGDRYNVSVTKDANGVYQVRVLWQNVSAKSSIDVSGTAYPGYDQLQLFYRI